MEVRYLAGKQTHIMWDKIKAFRLRRKCEEVEPQPLRVMGCTTRLTPEPDDAETAAAALLASLAAPEHKRRHSVMSLFRHGGKASKAYIEAGDEDNACRDAAYYHRLADRVRNGRATELRQATRYVAYCEQELCNPHLPDGLMADMERGLYRHLDTVERDGELKKRWQYCLADVTVRLMGLSRTEKAIAVNTGLTD